MTALVARRTLRAIVADPRVGRFISLAEQGMTAAQIGAAVGLSPERVTQLLREAGRPLASLRSVRCLDCGAVVPGVLRPVARCLQCRRERRRALDRARRRRMATPHGA